MRTLLCLILLVLFAVPVTAAAPPDLLSPAIRRGLVRLEQGSASYITKRDCFSCHHQTHTVAAFMSAKARGFVVPEKELKTQVDFTLATYKGKLDKVAKGEAVPGRNTTAGYALFTLKAADHAADATTAALVDFLVVQQAKDGSWPATANRPPTEGSRFATAALALEALQHYAPTSQDKTRRDKTDLTFDKGKAWLLKATPIDTEDQVFRLRGLVTLKEVNLIASARETLLKAQHDDGSWEQVPKLGGDAYATATVMMALRRAGLSADHAAYRRGVQYLLRTQTPEGAWLVATRSKPIQRFFDNGDPGGKDQFISFAATGWAVQALLECVPPR